MSRQSHREGKAPVWSWFTTERVGLVVLGTLLVVSVTFNYMYRICFETFWINRPLQTPRETDSVICSQDKSCPVCDEGWERHGNKCYHFTGFASPWAVGRRLCSEFNADLVKIESEEEQRFLMKKVKNLLIEAETKFWIGLTDSETEGTWLWVDGSELDDRLQFWWKEGKVNEPDHWTGFDPNGENCARMGEFGSVTNLKRWLDVSCKTDQRSICAKPAKGRQRMKAGVGTAV